MSWTADHTDETKLYSVLDSKGLWADDSGFRDEKTDFEDSKYKLDQGQGEYQHGIIKGTYDTFRVRSESVTHGYTVNKFESPPASGEPSENPNDPPPPPLPKRWMESGHGSGKGFYLAITAYHGSGGSSSGSSPASAHSSGKRPSGRPSHTCHLWNITTI